jgi:hypothetical protein
MVTVLTVGMPSDRFRWLCGEENPVQFKVPESTHLIANSFATLA